MTFQPRRGRKPRFQTPQEAEAWASGIAPPRGSNTALNEATRGPVRFWLRANQLPSAFVAGLTVAELGAAWHDTTGAALDALRTRAAAWIEAQGGSEIVVPGEDDDAQPELPTTTTQEAPQPMTTTQPPMDPRAAALAQALAALTAPPPAPSIDADAVRKILRDDMGAAMGAAAASHAEETRLALADLVEEARTIINGAPRALRIDIAGRIKEIPPAPRHPLFDTLLTLAACANEPGALCPMLVGPAGSGKTTACQHAADALGLDFYTTGAATGAHEYTGYMDAAGNYHGTPFRQAFEHGGLFLADELDRSDPGAVLVLNSALANRFMGFPDRAEPVRAHADFIMVVAANTYGRGADRLYVGANQLDAATNDRFAMLAWDYDETLERALAGDDAWTLYVQAARKAAMDAKMRVVISPRASIAGAIYRRAGLSFDQISEMVLWKGLDADQRAKINAAIPGSVRNRAATPVLTQRRAEAA